MERKGARLGRGVLYVYLHEWFLRSTHSEPKLLIHLQVRSQVNEILFSSNLHNKTSRNASP